MLLGVRRSFIMRRMENTPEIRAEIGARIGEAMVAAGYGQNMASAFARAVGVSPNTVYRWCSGAMVPDFWALEAISRVCRVSIDWIVRGEPSASTSEALDQWRKTPRGASATPAAVAFLRSLPLAGYVASPAFFDLALLAYEQGLTAPEAVAAAKLTTTVKG